MTNGEERQTLGDLPQLQRYMGVCNSVPCPPSVYLIQHSRLVLQAVNLPVSTAGIRDAAFASSVGTTGHQVNFMLALCHLMQDQEQKHQSILDKAREIWCSRFWPSISHACRLETNRHVPLVHYKHGGCTHGL